jgi:hypothetical protein
LSRAAASNALIFSSAQAKGLVVEVELIQEAPFGTNGAGQGGDRPA